MKDSQKQLVHLLNGEGIPVTSSKIIADAFSRAHKTVIEAIHLTISRFGGRNFGHEKNSDVVLDVDGYVVTEGSYIDLLGKQQKIYFMNEPFALMIVIGSFGIKADAIKRAFISEFARMRKQLEVQTLPNFEDPAEAAEAWAAEFRAKRQAQIEATHK